MRSRLLGGALAATAIMAISGATHAQTAKAIKWSPNFKAAMTSAKAGSKLVMVDFYTEW